MDTTCVVVYMKLGIIVDTFPASDFQLSLNFSY